MQFKCQKLATALSPFSLIALLTTSFGDCLAKMSAHRGKAADLISVFGQDLDRD